MAVLWKLGVRSWLLCISLSSAPAFPDRYQSQPLKRRTPPQKVPATTRARMSSTWFPPSIMLKWRQKAESWFYRIRKTCFFFNEEQLEGQLTFWTFLILHSDSLELGHSDHCIYSYNSCWEPFPWKAQFGLVDSNFCALEVFSTTNSYFYRFLQICETLHCLFLNVIYQINVCGARSKSTLVWSFKFCSLGGDKSPLVATALVKYKPLLYCIIVW